MGVFTSAGGPVAGARPWRTAKFALLGALACGACGCHKTVFKRGVNPLNPTSAVFPVTVGDVKAAVKRVAGPMSSASPIFGPLWKAQFFDVAFAESASPFAKEVFALPGTADDVFLQTFGAPLCASDVYRCADEPAEFRADFHLRLAKLGPRQTRVEVLVLRPVVICGASSSLLGVPGHSPVARLVDVEPTSIEEYRILLAIGADLGVKDMPPLRLPAADAKMTVVNSKGHY